jgi:DivIVA domain-containing protein
VPLTPEQVEATEFSSIKFGRKGYDEGEVDDFLEKVAVELRRLRTENEQLSSRVAELEQSPRQAAPAPEPSPAEAATGILAMAQRTADEHLADARASASRLLDEARSSAEQMARQADERERRVLGDLEEAKQGLERRIEALHAFEREYRSRLKAYLQSQLDDLEQRADEAPRGGPIAAGAQTASGSVPPPVSASATGDAATPAPA